ncbi:MAG: response regulator [Acidobacteriota bacterium]|nr:response regulator [Acidobacteriota bacterium]
MNDCESQKINILMVDDNESNLLALEAILQAPERNLVKASSGAEALRYLLDCDVAVILLDVYMPGIDGLETAALIRGREKSRTIPIIFLTAEHAGVAHLSKGYALGAVDYILKPVEPEILTSKVAVFVELFKKTEEIKRQAELLHDKNIELENANLQRLSALVELGQQLAAERNPVELLQKFCQAARDIVGARYAAVGMVDEEGVALRHFLTSGLDLQTAEKVGIPQIGMNIFGALVAEGRPLRLCDEGAAPGGDGYMPKDFTVSSCLGAHISTSAGEDGWLYLADKLDADEFSEADERLAVTLTSQVAVAYENARLYTEAQRHTTELQQEVAERIQAEEERARLLVREQAARADAEAANRTKDEFLATLSHELRTPLTSILGWVHLLRNGNLPAASSKSALETIERNAKAQSQLIDDLLDVSRIITGKLRIDSHPVEIKSVIEAAVDSVRPAATSKNIQLDMKVEQGVGTVLGDPNRLQQVAWNLFSNAVKFTPDGGRVEVRLSRSDSHVCVEVEDTGQGIGADFLPHVFDRFRQADGTTTRTHGGLGLGLAIVRHLVELHGGTIRADSRGENQGATFTVTLPAASADQSETETPQPDADAQSNGDRIPDCDATLDGLRVLVVDDETDTRDLIKVILSRCGAEVRTCGTTAEALKTFGEWKPDVLVSDIGMPEEDGYSLIKKLRALERGDEQSLPAVALTAYAGAEDRARALASGFQRHMAKPLEPRELVHVVAHLAEREAQV